MHWFVVFSVCDCAVDDPCDHGMCYCKTDSSDAWCDCDIGYTGHECDEPGKFGDFYIILYYFDRYQNLM